MPEEMKKMGKYASILSGLRALGFMETNKKPKYNEWSDLRYDDLAKLDAPTWIVPATNAAGKPLKQGRDVTFPAGTGPLCYDCADKIRTLPSTGTGPRKLDWQYVESARCEYRSQNNGAAGEFPWSCLDADGNFVLACDPKAVHGPVALQPEFKVPPSSRRGGADGRKWERKTYAHGYGGNCRWYEHTAMGMGLHPSQRGGGGGGGRETDRDDSLLGLRP